METQSKQNNYVAFSPQVSYSDRQTAVYGEVSVDFCGQRVCVVSTMDP